MFKEIEAIVLELIAKDSSLFLIAITISETNKINVIIDGDNGVSVNDCMTISRCIIKRLDSQQEDFSLEVSSPGAMAPITNKRQFRKNIGRSFSIILKSGEKIEGILRDANDEKLILEWKVREPKPVGKGKITVIKHVEKAYSDIEEAKVIIKFN